MIRPPQPKLKRMQDFGSQYIETTSLQRSQILGDLVCLSPAGVPPVLRVHFCQKVSLHPLGWCFKGSKLRTCVALLRTVLDGSSTHTFT